MKRLMQNDRQKFNQSGVISIIGALTLVLGMSGFYLTMELGNKMVSQSNFDNYAQALAPVVLRSELAISQQMVADGEGYKSQDLVHEFMADLGYEVGQDVAVTIKFGNMKDASSTWTDPKTNIEYKIDEEFIPLDQDGYSADVASHPKANTQLGELPPEFSAVSIEIKDTSGLLAFNPTGRAVYGLPAELEEGGDLGGCFCKNRFNACLLADIDTSTYPIELAGLISTPESESRRNYCEYGYAPAESNKTQYPSVDLSSQWLGLSEKVDESGFIRKLIEEGDLANFETVNQQKPLFVNNGANPFPNYYWNFWSRDWKPVDSTLWARDHSGNILVTGQSWFNWFGTKVKVDGPFYVGRQGTCIAGTNETNVPYISASVQNPIDAAQSPGDAEVERCLSYETSVGTEWSTSFFFMPVASSIDRYMQQSCVDYNRDKATRVGFFQWMIMSWTWPFINWQSSYEDLDCVARNMRWYGSFVFGGWRQI
ncbi:hypothetical protein [Thiomicrospira sp.]|uniref:hypothetical protein n=1 Tax=Thiomicrospira sp. TaxID=935 RepID=UPI002F9315E6